MYTGGGQHVPITEAFTLDNSEVLKLILKYLSKYGLSNSLLLYMSVNIA